MFQNTLLLLLGKLCYLLMLVTASPINYDGNDERKLSVGNLRTSNNGSTALDVMKNYANIYETKYERNLGNHNPPGELDKNDSPGEASTGYKRNPNIKIPDELNGSLKELPCMNSQQRFESNVKIRFEGSSSIITQLDIVRIQNSFIETYNKLSTQNCDDLHRMVNSASIETPISIDSNQGFSINFNVESTCRGCDIKTTSLFADSDRKLSTRSNWNHHIKKVRDRNYRTRHGKKWREQHWVKPIKKSGKKMPIEGEESSWKVEMYPNGIADPEGCVCEFQDANFRSPSEEEFRSSYDESVSIIMEGINHVGQVSEIESLPTVQPSHSSILSEKPSEPLSLAPSFGPSSLNAGTLHPSIAPSESSRQPSKEPTRIPSNFPSYHPSLLSSDLPSSRASGLPSGKPSNQPSSNGSPMPSIQPSGIPLSLPSGEPSQSPSGNQSFPPSITPSGVPSFVPFALPSSQPSRLPSIQPLMPSGNPTITLSDRPSHVQSSEPSLSLHSGEPSQSPSENQSFPPSITPSGVPSFVPFALPSSQPSRLPSIQPLMPSGNPTIPLSDQPSYVRSSEPSLSLHSGEPSQSPSGNQSFPPSITPSGVPSFVPFALPSSQPSQLPSIQPLMPSGNPTIPLSDQPSYVRSSLPSNEPSIVPSGQSSDLPTNSLVQLPFTQTPTDIRSEICNQDSECQSSVCVDGICLEGKQENLDLCDDNNDCTSGWCYLQNFTENAEQVCCPESYVLVYADDIPWSNTLQYYCRYQQPTGGLCAHNDLCEGGVCVDGICLEGKQENLDLCDDNNDCTSGWCYLQNFTENAEQVCCPESYVLVYADDIPWSNTLQYYCRYQQSTGGLCAHNDLCEGGVCVDGICLEGKQENLDLCDDNNDCTSGWCYLQNFTENAEQVCCPESYVLVYADDIPWSNTLQYYCRYQQPTGGLCAHNDLCEGGVCVDGICLEGKQENLDLCDDNNDCTSGWCYLQNFTENAEQVCCPESYVLVYADDIPWSNTLQYYCRYQQSTGSLCAHNDLCEGGVCVDGICLEGKQENLDLCDDNNDCTSGWCYLQNFTENAEQVCCPESYVLVYADDIPWSNTLQYYCRYQQPTGGLCAHNDLCEGGVCVDGICLEGKQENLDLCDDNNDCTSGWCYLQNFTENAEQVCCPANYVPIYADDIPWSNTLQYYCRYQQPTGKSCAHNDLCEGGVCVDGICLEGKQENLDLCDDNNDCTSGWCYLQNFTENAEQVCCPASYVPIYADDIPWSNTLQYYCRYQQSTGGLCAHNDLCEGGVCVDGICLEGKQENLDLCDDNNDCTSGWCYLQNFTENAEQVCCPESYVLVYADDIPWSNTLQYYCRYQQPIGASCVNNELCAGAKCQDNLCVV